MCTERKVGAFLLLYELSSIFLMISDSLEVLKKAVLKFWSLKQRRIETWSLKQRRIETSRVAPAGFEPAAFVFASTLDFTPREQQDWKKQSSTSSTDLRRRNCKRVHNHASYPSGHYFDHFKLKVLNTRFVSRTNTRYCYRITRTTQNSKRRITVNVRV